MFANSRPLASNFKSFSRSLEQFFLTVGQNSFGNKICTIFVFWILFTEQKSVIFENCATVSLVFLIGLTEHWQGARSSPWVPPLRCNSKLQRYPVDLSREQTCFDPSIKEKIYHQVLFKQLIQFLKWPLGLFFSFLKL